MPGEADTVANTDPMGVPQRAQTRPVQSCSYIVGLRPSCSVQSATSTILSLQCRAGPPSQRRADQWNTPLSAHSNRVAVA